MRLTIDTETDTYEQAIAAVQSAYGLRPVVPPNWPEASAVGPDPTRRAWAATTSGTAGAIRCRSV